MKARRFGWHGACRTTVCHSVAYRGAESSSCRAFVGIQASHMWYTPVHRNSVVHPEAAILAKITLFINAQRVGQHPTVHKPYDSYHH